MAACKFGLLCFIAILQMAISSSDTKQIDNLEKQVQIVLNLVHAQSTIMASFQNQEVIKDNPYLIALNQTKNIIKLQEELKRLDAFTKTQESQIQQLQSSVEELSKKVAGQEKKLGSIDAKYTSEVFSLRSELTNSKGKTTILTSQVNTLGTKIQQLSGTWPNGKYCILASGPCPAGFTRSSGHMRAISLFSGKNPYINQAPAVFGDSKIKCHGKCGQYGHWTGELYITACCK